MFKHNQKVLVVSAGNGSFIATVTKFRPKTKQVFVRSQSGTYAYWTSLESVVKL